MTRRPGLLVSVRSPEEALSAVAGGASVIDVKEPARGPLGMADVDIWQSVRAAVPPEIPVSVALGEFRDWINREPPPPSAFSGVAYRKMGLAGAGRQGDWADHWASIRQRFGPGPPWIAVIYTDHVAAEAPSPPDVIGAASECAGVLIDTWDKRSASTLDPSWAAHVHLIRERSGLVALAGGLDAARIERLRGLDPDWFAVRGAACVGGDRLGGIETRRVADLVALVGRRS